MSAAKQSISDTEHIGRHKACTACDCVRATEEHRGQHWECAPCFKIKCASVRFDKLDERSTAVRQRDKDFARDSAAYKRLRAEGLQPRGVDKSALLEAHADHKLQVELGRPVTKEQIKAFNRDLGPIV